MIAAGILAAAGTAHAAPMIQIVEDEGFAFTGVSRFTSTIDRIEDGVDEVAFLTDEVNVTFGVAFAADDLGPGVDGAFANASLGASFSSTGFSLAGTTSGAVVTNDLYADTVENFATATGATIHQGSVTLTEDAMVRIRVAGSADASEPNTEWTHRVEISGGSLSPFVIGLEDSTNGPSIDTILNLEAGEYSWEFGMDFGANSGFPGANGYSWDSSLEFSFEIIPAPGAAALFGLAGLTATRRRR